MAGGRGLVHEAAVSASVEWFTPRWIFEKLGIRFDTDPCHPIIPLPWVPVRLTYNVNDDGLAQIWVGNVWLNPPYGKGMIKWMKRMHEHGRGIALVFARTDTRWFHLYCAKADAILFLEKRVKFVDRDEKTAGTPGCGSMLVAWGAENVKVLEECGIPGALVKLR